MWTYRHPTVAPSRCDPRIQIFYPWFVDPFAVPSPAHEPYGGSRASGKLLGKSHCECRSRISSTHSTVFVSRRASAIVLPVPTWEYTCRGNRRKPQYCRVKQVGRLPCCGGRIYSLSRLIVSRGFRGGKESSRRWKADATGAEFSSVPPVLIGNVGVFLHAE